MAAADLPPFCMTVAISDVDFEHIGEGATSRGPLTFELWTTAPHGAFGWVFLGWWRRMRAAIKIIPSKAGVSADHAHEDFMREAENMLAVRGVIDRARLLTRVGLPLSEPCGLADGDRRCREPHDLRGWKHLACIYGVGTVPDLGAVARGLPPGPAHLVVMEPLTGGSLKTPPRPEAVILRAPTELSAGLAALAAAHVVHADLKPENVMLRTPGGELVLTDYGVGRIARGGVDEAVYYGTAGGTVVYMAPELLDERHASTFASDMCVVEAKGCAP